MAKKIITGKKSSSERISIKSEQILADFAITTHILGALKTNPQISVYDVEVSTKKGCVILKGNLQCEFQEEIVKDLIENIEGVKKLKTHIAISPSASRAFFCTYSAN